MARNSFVRRQPAKPARAAAAERGARVGGGQVPYRDVLWLDRASPGSKLALERELWEAGASEDAPGALHCQASLLQASLCCYAIRGGFP